MRCVLGVDGGASKVHAVVLESTGRFLGFGSGGSCNYQSSGVEVADASLRQAVAEASHEAGVSADQLDLGYFCLAGADLPEDFTMLQAAVERLKLCRETRIENDTVAVLRAGATRPWGVAVVCGTGFNAMGRAPDGREVRLPSLGPLSGDWGGGLSLSEEIIRAVMRAWDGRGNATLLTQLVLEKLDIVSEEDLLMKLYHRQIGQAALLGVVPLLFDAALARDPVAADLVVRMGQEAGITASTLIRRLSMEDDDVEVILGGSIFKGKGPLLVDAVTTVVHREVPKAQILPLRREPVVGAALLGLEALGDVTEQCYRTFQESLPRDLSPIE
jgi:N-acetylglucosamine kinase-like BadF-type ATPase